MKLSKLKIAARGYYCSGNRCRGTVWFEGCENVGSDIMLEAALSENKYLMTHGEN